MDDVDATRELAVAEAAGIRCCWMRRPSNEADMPSIYVMDGGWRVSTTNERATEESVKDYSDREEAIGDFVKRVHGFVEYQSDGSRRCPGGGRRQHVDVYDERGLPYLEDANQYHQYEVVHDVGDLGGAYDALDGDHKELVDALLQQRNKTADDLGSLGAYRGEIAAVGRFGSPGGGVQVQLPLPAEILQVLGVLREIPLH